MCSKAGRWDVGLRCDVGWDLATSGGDSGDRPGSRVEGCRVVPCRRSTSIHRCRATHLSWRLDTPVRRRAVLAVSTCPTRWPMWVFGWWLRRTLGSSPKQHQWRQRNERFLRTNTVHYGVPRKQKPEASAALKSRTTLGLADERQRGRALITPEKRSSQSERAGRSYGTPLYRTRRAKHSDHMQRRSSPDLGIRSQSRSSDTRASANHAGIWYITARRGAAEPAGSVENATPAAQKCYSLIKIQCWRTSGHLLGVTSWHRGRYGAALRTWVTLSADHTCEVLTTSRDCEVRGARGRGKRATPVNLVRVQHSTGEPCGSCAGTKGGRYVCLALLTAVLPILPEWRWAEGTRCWESCLKEAKSPRLVGVTEVDVVAHTFQLPYRLRSRETRLVFVGDYHVHCFC